MALNFSHRPLFPAHLNEDNLVAPMRIANGYLVDGRPDQNNGDSFCRSWHSNGEIEGFFDYGKDKGDRRYDSHDSVSKDILDLLPSDPFGMDISSTVTAITGWLEDLEVGGYKKDEVGMGDGNYQLFAELNFIWNNAMRFQAFPGNVGFEHKAHITSGFGTPSEEKDVRDASCHGGFGSACNVEDVLSYGNSNFRDCSQDSESHSDGGAPHAALLFALDYLGVQDLLVVETVCKSLRSTVQNDPLYWRSIHIDQPLNEKITDGVLLELTNRAQGNLQCLSLVDCPWITDDGLKRVLENNPRLAKLSVPGCTRLSIEGIVNSLKAFNSMGGQGVKHLRIGGLYGVTQKHFEELKCLLGTDDQTSLKKRKPHFYHRGNFYLSCEDDRAIDVEMCPRCQNLKLVYDCPLESCQGKEHATQVCRGCTLCIARCVQCGRCIYDNEYEETFSLEWICSDCGKQRQDRNIETSKHHSLHQPSSLCLYG
ncbi:hypothetical protein SLA2020_126390 [Shorea laevis]